MFRQIEIHSLSLSFCYLACNTLYNIHIRRDLIVQEEPFFIRLENECHPHDGKTFKRALFSSLVMYCL